MKNLLLLVILAFSVTGFAQDCTVAAAVPYSEDFSNGDPACWTYENTDGSNPVWAYNNSVDITGDGTNDPLLVIIPPNVGATAKNDCGLYTKNPNGCWN